MFGAVVGLERKSRFKEAGLRTHFIVALGSALVMIVSKYGFADMANDVGAMLDPSRIAAQVVSGIGFLGAGAIIVQRQSVRGLTTAAGLWATAGIGLGIGAGMYWESAGATVLVLIALEVLDKGERFLLKRHFEIAVRTNQLNRVLAGLSANRVKVMDIQVQMEDGSSAGEAAPCRAMIQCQAKGSGSVDKLSQLLQTIEGVKEFKIT